MFRCDVTDPLKIPECPLVTSARDVRNLSGLDDFAHLPNGNLLTTYMGAKNLATPGGLVELGLDGSVGASIAPPGRGADPLPKGNAVTLRRLAGMTSGVFDDHDQLLCSGPHRCHRHQSSGSPAVGPWQRAQLGRLAEGDLASIGGARHETQMLADLSHL